MDIPTSREEVICELRGMNIQAVRVGSRDIPLENAENKYLYGIYIGRVRSQRARERKAERFLTTNDW